MLNTASHPHIDHLSTRGRCDTIIFDLGDVIFNWSFPFHPAIAPTTAHNIMHTQTWHELERGHLNEHDCYARVAADFNLTVNDLGTFAQGTRASMRCDPAMLALLERLRMREDVRLYAMSNISAADWDYLERTVMEQGGDWTVFDAVFTSAAVGERKPDLAFYRHVLAKTGVDPSRTVFVDDKAENVEAARRCGMQGVVFTGAGSLELVLDRLVGGASRHAGSHLPQGLFENRGCVPDEKVARHAMEPALKLENRSMSASVIWRFGVTDLLFREYSLSSPMDSISVLTSIRRDVPMVLTVGR